MVWSCPHSLLPLTWRLQLTFCPTLTSNQSTTDACFTPRSRFPAHPTITQTSHGEFASPVLSPEKLSTLRSKRNPHIEVWVVIVMGTHIPDQILVMEPPRFLHPPQAAAPKNKALSRLRTMAYPPVMQKMNRCMGPAQMAQSDMTRTTLILKEQRLFSHVSEHLENHRSAIWTVLVRRIFPLSERVTATCGQ